jgi:hypothetical protein
MVLTTEPSTARQLLLHGVKVTGRRGGQIERQLRRDVGEGSWGEDTDRLGE